MKMLMKEVVKMVRIRSTVVQILKILHLLFVSQVMKMILRVIILMKIYFVAKIKKKQMKLIFKLGRRLKKRK
jgi:hypothetical protein